MLFYNVDYQNVGISSLSYPSLEGELEINLFDDFRNAFITNGIYPLSEYRNTSSIITEHGLYVTVNPLLKITEGLDKVPFGTTPEARYKIGSYSYIKGYEIITNEDGSIQSFPYESEPSFINYERNALKSGYFIATPGLQAFEALQVNLDGGEPGVEPCIPIVVSPYYSGSFALSYCAGISLNLNDGLIADLVVTYQYSVVPFYLDSVYPDYLYVY